MRTPPENIIFIFLIIVTIIETISFITTLCFFNSKKFKIIYSIAYSLISICFISTVSYLIINFNELRNIPDYKFMYFTIGFATLYFIPKIVFFCGIIISSIILIFSNKYYFQVALNCFIIISLCLGFVFGYGIIYGRHSIVTNNIDLYFSDLPKEINNIKIIHFSDLHLSSFQKNTKTIDKVVEIINNENADLVLFTGDIVNNFASEIYGFENILSNINSKYGKFAIYGNHDYGGYSDWNSEIDKAKNHNEIYKELKSYGFNMLCNENAKILINDTCIYIIGVENWGKYPFPQLADLDIASKEIPENAFNILMTHDPEHWNEVIEHNKNIKLSLSGHTHGGQLGLKFAGITFSPMYFIQRFWAGLYSYNNQFLYVNRGLGTGGFPGRIDMNPEITVINLHSKQ